MDRTEFSEMVRPLAAALRAIALADPDAARVAIEAATPVDGELVQGIRAAATAGAEEGWLLTKEHAGVRYGRVAKDLEGFSVDAVMMDGLGPRHRHPRGEIDLMFNLEGAPTFDDGRAPGWTVYAPDSVHVPSVRDGKMLILYFLPGGEIEWL